MPQNNQNLSYHELLVLLERSTSLQSHQADKDFTEQDLLEIADELGLERSLVQRVVAEHLQKRSQVEVLPRPFNTRIELTSTPNTFDLKLPATMFNLGSVFKGVAMMFGLMIVGLFTLFASLAGWFSFRSG